MWFFMITCYIMTAATLLSLLLNGLQGYWHFDILKASHATFALFTIIIYLFTQSLIIFYFVGIGVSIKEYCHDKKLDSSFHKKSLAIKRYVYPPILLNILLVMILFIIGGAVDTKKIPGWAHGILFWITLLHYFKTIVVQNKAFRESTAIVLEMSGLSLNNKTTPPNHES